QLGDDKLRAVRQQESDTIARLDALSQQGGSKGIAQPREFTAGHTAPPAEEGRVGGPLDGRIGNIIQQHLLRIGRQPPGHPRIIVRKPWLSSHRLSPSSLRYGPTHATCTRESRFAAPLPQAAAPCCALALRRLLAAPLCLDTLLWL